MVMQYSWAQADLQETVCERGARDSPIVSFVLMVPNAWSTGVTCCHVKQQQRTTFCNLHSVAQAYLKLKSGCLRP